MTGEILSFSKMVGPDGLGVRFMGKDFAPRVPQKAENYVRETYDHY